MARSEVRLVSGKFFKAMDHYPADVARKMALAMRRIGNEFVATFTKGSLTGRPGVRRRTGTLARSVFVGVTGKVDEGNRSAALVITIGGGASKYAPIHEFGGTITARKSKFLAIPLPAARTASGVSRYASPRDVPGLKLIKSRAGNLLLVKERRGRGGATQIEPWYVLKRSIQIPPRLDFFRTFKDEAPGMQVKLGEAVDKATEGFNRGGA